MTRADRRRLPRGRATGPCLRGMHALVAVLAVLAVAVAAPVAHSTRSAAPLGSGSWVRVDASPGVHSWVRGDSATRLDPSASGPTTVVRTAAPPRSVLPPPWPGPVPGAEPERLLGTTAPVALVLALVRIVGAESRSATALPRRRAPPPIASS